MKAGDFLKQARGHMLDRAKTYDNPEGERSMQKTVNAFKCITNVSMTTEQGWLFMALLKAVRSQQGEFKADNYEDGAAYFALAGEQAFEDRCGPKPGEFVDQYDKLEELTNQKCVFDRKTVTGQTRY